MKKYMLLVLFALSFSFVQGDEKKHFSKEENVTGHFLYIPLFEENEFKKQGKQQESFVVDSAYIHELINSILSRVLSAEEIRQLERNEPHAHRRDTISESVVGIYFDHTGKVGHVFFALPAQDTVLFDDQKLLKLHQLIKSVTIDMSKGRILKYYDPKDEDCYFLLMPPLYTWGVDEKRKK